MATLNVQIPDAVVPELAKALWGPVDSLSGPMPANGPAIKQRVVEWLKSRYRQHANAKVAAEARASNEAEIETQIGGFA